MEIAGQGPADRCPGGPLGKLSNYADAYVRIYVFVRLRMCEMCIRDSYCIVNPGLQ